MMRETYRWLDERLDLQTLWRVLLARKVPLGVGWFYVLGFASLFVLVLQAVTGIALGLYYSPSPDHAYDSILYIDNEVTFGSLVRGLHHWGASAMVVLTFLHGAAVFVMGAYKYPRELTWLVGVALFMVVLGFSFTGYLLPWDEKAYWATTVGTNMAGTVPFVGSILLKVVQGGAQVGAVTLTRFYALHIMVLPLLLLLLLAVHLYLVFKQGVSVPPRLWEGRPSSTGGSSGGVGEGDSDSLRERHGPTS